MVKIPWELFEKLKKLICEFTQVHIISDVLLLSSDGSVRRIKLS